MEQKPMQHFQVVVIGAGVSGLQCAQRLVKVKNFYKVLVVDALNRVGGRILQETEFIPGLKIEVGAEFVHGDNTSTTKLAKKNQWPLREIFTWAQGDGGPTDPASDGGIGYYYLGDQERLLAYNDEDPDFRALNHAVFNISNSVDLAEVTGETSVLEYFKNAGLSESMIKLAEAGYGNTAGASLGQISLRRTYQFEKQWIEIESEGDFRMANSYGQVVDALVAEVPTLLKWRVKLIDYTSSDHIVVTSTTGERVSCDRVVVTVPISVFEKIEYEPSLPQEKLKAARSFGMRRAIKVFMHFSDRFWPADAHGMICSDCFMPEFWPNSTHGIGTLIPNGDPCAQAVEDSQVANKELHYLITGFAGADHADRIAQMPQDTVISVFLAQLDRIFATKENPSPASRCFVKGQVRDWGLEETIAGGYSYPRVGQRDEDPFLLAKPVDNRIFFAGEATAFEQPGMTVHSAIDTGVRAANEVHDSMMP